MQVAHILIYAPGDCNNVIKGGDWCAKCCNVGIIFIIPAPSDDNHVICKVGCKFQRQNYMNKLFHM